MSLDDSVPSTPPRTQQNVLARLQALFPNSPASVAALPSSTTSQGPSEGASSAEKFVKIRIVTWNMHDALPKGDLEELLGFVPPHNTTDPFIDQSKFPTFPAEENHPYHLIAVAGQECPTVSGIPMGLGAGFKYNHRDREKDKIRPKDTGSREGDADSSKEFIAGKVDPVVNKRKDPEETHIEPPASVGWTAMVEDWLCSGAATPAAPMDRSMAMAGADLGLDQRHLSSEGTSLHVVSNGTPKGLYQMLIKERMMGIYLAVFVHRDVRNFVRGFSKSAVTAGLIGGRVGNKGGVGISVNLDGATFLFVNAHLAAHEGKVHNRLANLAKIKTELNVNDFLEPDDPRVMAEDVTDKFDYTFLFGDLNFRLELSRLHADWLISRQEYEQALAFDQLRKEMQTGEAFTGFYEAPIAFPPTFKYDVLRTIKKGRRKSAPRAPWKLPAQRPPRLTEDDEADLDNDDGAEAESVISTVFTSGASRNITDTEDDDDTRSSPEVNDNGVFSRRNSKTGGFSQALLKAKSAWTAMLSPSTPNLSQTANRKPRKTKRLSSTSVVPSPIPPSPYADLPDRPLLSRARSHSHISLSKPEDAEVNGEVDRGVYDSSVKQRVPSWCDRILWKSTVLPDSKLDPHEDSLATPIGYRTRVGHLLATAFRPLRARAESPSSSHSFEIAALNEAGGAPSTDKLNVERSSTAVSSSNSPSRPARFPRSSTVDSSPSLLSQRAIWRLLPFLSRDSQSAGPLRQESVQDGEAHHKGDVVCLNYTTLNDRGMRRLEGRSDHRPVIGSYAAYI